MILVSNLLNFFSLFHIALNFNFRYLLNIFLCCKDMEYNYNTQ